MQHAMSNDANTDHSKILSQMSNSATRVSESQQQLQAQIQHMQHAMGVLQSQVTNQASQQNRGYQPGPSSGYQHSNGYQDHLFPGAGYQEQGYRGSGYQSNDYQKATPTKAMDIKATASSNVIKVAFRGEAVVAIIKDE
jgi:hypothetical protein